MKKTLSLLIVFQFFIGICVTAATTIRIAHPKDYYPYSATNEKGESIGILIDWWTLWAEKAGVDVQFIADSRENCVQLVLEGKADLVAALYYNENLIKQLDFADYIMRTKTVLFLKKGDKPKSITDLEHEVYVLDNPLLKEVIESQFSGVQIKEGELYSSLAEKVDAESIEAFIYDVPNPIARYKSTIDPKGYYQYLVLKSDKLRPAVKKGNTDMLDLILKGTSRITDAELVQIAEKWPVFRKNRTVLKLVLVFVSVLLIIGIIFTYVLQNLKKKRNPLTKPADGTDWQIIIDKGENDYIEFKSSMRWDYREEKPNKVLEQVIVKTISAFLNTKGGMLFIGVDDDGNTLGLENDYNTLKKKNQDGFLLALTSLINQSLGKAVHKFITISIISINDKDVCIVSVDRSTSPVFLGKNGKEEFYIRASASSQPMSMRETFEYIKTNWGEN